MRKAPMAIPCGAGMAMDGLPPRFEQSDTTAKVEVEATGDATGARAEANAIGLTDVATKDGTGRRLSPPSHS